MVSIEDILSGVHDHSFVASNQSYPFFWHTRDTISLRLSMDDILIDKNESYWLEVTDKLDSIGQIQFIPYYLDVTRLYIRPNTMVEIVWNFYWIIQNRRRKQRRHYLDASISVFIY